MSLALEIWQNADSTWQNGAQLAGWLAGGMLFTEAAIRWSGENIVSQITERAGRTPLTPAEHHHLETWQDNVCAGWRRRGTLVTASGVKVAEITAVYLPDRIGDRDVIESLQCTDTPLGLALRPLDVTRHSLAETRMTACGPFAVEAAGMLRLPGGLPVALSTEKVYRSFTARMPAPAVPAT